MSPTRAQGLGTKLSKVLPSPATPTPGNYPPRLYGTGGRNCDCRVSAGAAGDAQEGVVCSDGAALPGGIAAAGPGVDAAGLSNRTISFPAAGRAAMPEAAYTFVRLGAAVTWRVVSRARAAL
jgi:hypothetical protein